jgi:hypothetical protein
MPAASPDIGIAIAYGSMDVERGCALAAAAALRARCILVLGIVPRTGATRKAGPRWQVWLSRCGAAPRAISGHRLKAEAEQQIRRLASLLAQYDATDDAAFAALVEQLKQVET